MSHKFINQSTAATFLTNITQILVASNLDQFLKALVKINFFDWSDKNHTWWLFDNKKTFFQDQNIKLGDAKLSFTDILEQLKAFATACNFIFPTNNAAQSNRPFNELDFKCAKVLNKLGIKNRFSMPNLHATKLAGLKLDHLTINIKSDKKPKYLIFMDNDLEQLKLLQMLCCKEKINFFGIHYFTPKSSFLRPDPSEFCNPGKTKNPLQLASI